MSPNAKGDGYDGYEGDDSNMHISHIELESLLLMPSNRETGEYHLKDTLMFAYNDVRNVKIGSITETI